MPLKSDVNPSRHFDMTHRNNILTIFCAAFVIGCLPAPLSGKEPAAGKTGVAAAQESGRSAGADKTAADYMDGFDCGTGKAGWKRAKAITPNLVGPCNTGSGGSCEGPGFQYVRGTGWCRPR
jgi:hypothetical protein